MCVYLFDVNFMYVCETAASSLLIVFEFFIDAEMSY